MKKTAIAEAIESLEFRLEIEKQLENDVVGHVGKQIHGNRITTIEKSIFELQSLLPLEREQIESAFDKGYVVACNIDFDIDEEFRNPLYKDAQDYFTRNYDTNEQV